MKKKENLHTQRLGQRRAFLALVRVKAASERTNGSARGGSGVDSVAFVEQRDSGPLRARWKGRFVSTRSPVGDRDWQVAKDV